MKSENDLKLICSEHKEIVDNGLVFVRSRCEWFRCVKWRAGVCQMCKTESDEDSGKISLPNLYSEE